MDYKQQKQALADYWKKSLDIDKKLINAFMKTKRENFILERYKDDAYGDHPLPIIKEQTISQPTTVIIMTDALDLKETDKVLEIGAGSGYQAAIIAKIVKKGFIYTTEFFSEVAGFAEKNLEKEGIINVEVIHTDGSKGYKTHAPYDKIIVTAACPEIPLPLVEQLKVGGIIVCPVGTLIVQDMVKGVKVKKAKGLEGLVTSSLGAFRFVPLRGEYGFE